MKGVHGRLKKLEVNGKNIVIEQTLPARADDSTVVEVPQNPVVASGKMGLNIPWQIVFKLLGILALVLLGAGFYIGNGNDKEEMIRALNRVMITTQALKTQVKSLSVPVEEYEPTTIYGSSSEDMMREVP